MDYTIQLGEEKIPKLLFEFSMPAIIGMVVSALYNFTDRVFIGNGPGALGIAGITIGFPIMMVVVSFAMLIGMGATALVSIKIGEQKADEARHIVGNAFVLLMVLSVILTITGLLFLKPILIIFGASSEILPFATEYMGVILLGTVFQMITLGMNSFIRAEGKPKKAMVTILIGAALNVILAPLFIFGFKWGMKGAALATVLSQAVSAAWVLSHFLDKRNYFKIHMNNLRLQYGLVGQIFLIGATSFIMQIIGSIYIVIMNKGLVKYGGDIAVSGMGAVNSVLYLIIMPVFGISQGVQPIIGFNFGAKKFSRVKEALKDSIIAATIITSSAFILTRLLGYHIISIFSQDKEFVAFGGYAQDIVLLLLPVLGVQMIGSGYFQAVGKPKQAMFLTLSKQLFFIAALFILPHYYHLQGVLISAPLSDLLAFIVTGIWLLIELKNLSGKQYESHIKDMESSM